MGRINANANTIARRNANLLPPLYRLVSRDLVPQAGSVILMDKKGDNDAQNIGGKVAYGNGSGHIAISRTPFLIGYSIETIIQFTSENAGGKYPFGDTVDLAGLYVGGASASIYNSVSGGFSNTLPISQSIFDNVYHTIKLTRLTSTTVSFYIDSIYIGEFNKSFDYVDSLIGRGSVLRPIAYMSMFKMGDVLYHLNGNLINSIDGTEATNYGVTFKDVTDVQVQSTIDFNTLGGIKRTHDIANVNPDFNEGLIGWGDITNVSLVDSIAVYDINEDVSFGALSQDSFVIGNKYKYQVKYRTLNDSALKLYDGGGYITNLYLTNDGEWHECESEEFTALGTLAKFRKATSASSDVIEFEYIRHTEILPEPIYIPNPQFTPNHLDIIYPPNALNLIPSFINTANASESNTKVEIAALNPFSYETNPHGYIGFYKFSVFPYLQSDGQLPTEFINSDFLNLHVADAYKGRLYFLPEYDNKGNVIACKRIVVYDRSLTAAEQARYLKKYLPIYTL